MGQMTAEMVVEDLVIAMDSGRCPRCMAPLQIQTDDDEIMLSCSVCSWRGGLGGAW